MNMFEKNMEVVIGGYTVTFNHSTFKTSIRRNDGKKIDQSSEKFKKDLEKIKRTKEYIAHMNLMKMESTREKKAVNKSDEDKLFEFTKHLLSQDN